MEGNGVKTGTRFNACGGHRSVVASVAAVSPVAASRKRAEFRPPHGSDIHSIEQETTEGVEAVEQIDLAFVRGQRSTALGVGSAGGNQETIFVHLCFRRFPLFWKEWFRHGIFAVLAVMCFAVASARADQATLIVAIGASGEEAYASPFEGWASNWTAAAIKGGAKSIVIGRGETNATADVEQLKEALRAEPKESDLELWLVLIGHGTFDGKEAKFNLRGPDLSAGGLAEALKPFNRPIAIIDC
jgi:hypothetical protein